jgi:hypothetical protein
VVQAAFVSRDQKTIFTVAEEFDGFYSEDTTCNKNTLRTEVTKTNQETEALNA